MQEESQEVLNSAIKKGPSKEYDFQLLKQCRIYERLDVVPIAFTVSLLAYFFGTKVFDREEILPVVCLILAITFHSILFFINFWNADANVQIAYRKLNLDQIHDATHVWVKVHNKKQETTKKQVVPVITKSLETTPGNLETIKSIEYMKKRMVWNAKQVFQSCPYPTKETIEHYKTHIGFEEKKEIAQADLVHGSNKMDIPIPTFIDLYKEHLVAPFFVFQLFCTLLWLLDEYWYYSLFNLGMLFFFEGTVVMQRLQNMKRLRSMRKAAEDLWVFRYGKWEKMSSYDLYPGDIILLRYDGQKKKQNIPCDMLLLSGSAVVNEAILTGESQPLVKESIANVDDEDEELDIKGFHKNHILNSGTEILQHIPSDLNADLPHLSPAPCEDGIACYILKNGFETKQGKLMRMILFSSDRVTVESVEVYYYLLILLIFALMASYHVMKEGLKDPDRSRYKIMLRCVLIITNVVPPELPMELSLTVNYAIIAMIKKSIFCTEPFRIPNAGKIDICCFDKTGTLTANDLIIKGLCAVNLANQTNWTPKKGTVVDQNIIELDQVHKQSKDALLVLAGCHTLAMAGDKLVGDPIEKQAFEGIKFKHDGRRTSMPRIGHQPKVLQLKRFLFESSLKRQSAIINVDDGTTRNGRNKVVCKGAPEVIEKYLKNVPEGYTEHYINFVKDGARVLALAHRDLKMQTQEAQLMTRDEAEKDLEFCGFIISVCPLKEDSKAVIEELVYSNHEVKMITGDNQLTAAFVAQELNFAPDSQRRSLFVGSATPGSEQIKWNDLDGKPTKTTNGPNEVQALSKEYLLCITGPLLDKVFQMTNVAHIIRSIHVFSRTSPNQKTAIVAQYNKLGNVTMMTGDGTNDVGSLKRADVGLAVVNNPPVTKEQKKAKKEMSWMPATKDLAGLTFTEQTKKIQEHQKEYQKTMAAGMGDAQMELGDACIAAPFTYKFQSLKSVKRLIREGRKTLTTTFQMYKILSLNSLISAYTMSALYLDGIKMGDYQATYMGMGISFIFIFLSFTTPIKKLQKERSPSSIFHWSLVVSVAIQFAVHMYVLVYFSNLCEPFIDRENDESLIPDGEFKPNLKNSVFFIYQWWLQCTVVACNYSGWPFQQSMWDNRKLKWLLAANFLVLSGCIYNINDEIREKFELVPYPNDEFKETVITHLVGDLVICYTVEYICKQLYLQTFHKK